MRLARSVMPPHLKMETYWISALQMQYFEDGYKKWRESMSENASADIRALHLKKMTDALSDDFMSGRRRDDNTAKEEHEEEDA